MTDGPVPRVLAGLNGWPVNRSDYSARIERSSRTGLDNVNSLITERIAAKSGYVIKCVRRAGCRMCGGRQDQRRASGRPQEQDAGEVGIVAAVAEDKAEW